MFIHFFRGLKQKQFQLKCESKNRDRGWFPHELNPRLAVSYTHFLLNSVLSWNFTVMIKSFASFVFLFFKIIILCPFHFFFMSKTELKTQSLPSSKDGVACVSMIIVLQSYISFSVCRPYYWNSLMHNVFNY